MKCENSFCVYQMKGKCVLDSVGIDNTGMCTECIYPDIDEKILAKAKSDFLNNGKKTGDTTLKRSGNND